MGEPIRLHNAALEERDNGDIVLRGGLDITTLKNLLVDDYQREAQPVTRLSVLSDVFARGGAVTDIELGMRGHRFIEDHGKYELLDPVYIVDGLQRKTALEAAVARNPGCAPRLGAMVWFATSKEWERERFIEVNLLRKKVAPSKHLYNEREKSIALLTLYGISHSVASPINERVCWADQMHRSDLLSAMTLASTACLLHRHLLPGLSRGSGVGVAINSLNNLTRKIRLADFRRNVEEFWVILDEAFGIRSIIYKQNACWVRRAFLETLAWFFSDHLDFWEGPNSTLKMPGTIKRKFGTFPVRDPEVIRLSGSSGKARQILYQLLVDHINSGKRTQHLRHRIARPIDPIFDDVAEHEQAAASAEIAL